MAIQKVDKALIIGKAYQIFREKGYHYTTMADIALSCGLLKGSIYHYFSSKEELMKQVLLTDHQFMKSNIYALAYDEHLSYKERFKQLLQALNSFYFNEPGGCLMANIGLESAQVAPEFTLIIKNFFEDWITTFAYVFQSQYEPAQARIMAEQAVQEIEGAIMLSVIYKDKKYFLATADKILNYLK